MIEIPAFNVRSYPPFRMARLHRVYVDREALYPIRMRGVIGNADAGSRFELHPGRALTGSLPLKVALLPMPSHREGRSLLIVTRRV
jgi:hypothetical protein